MWHSQNKSFVRRSPSRGCKTGRPQSPGAPPHPQPTGPGRAGSKDIHLAAFAFQWHSSLVTRQVVGTGPSQAGNVWGTEPARGPAVLSLGTGLPGPTEVSGAPREAEPQNEGTRAQAGRGVCGKEALGWKSQSPRGTEAPAGVPYLSLGLRRVFHIQVLSCLFHLVVGFLTQVLGLRRDFFWGENKEGLVTWTMTSIRTCHLKEGTGTKEVMPQSIHNSGTRAALVSPLLAPAEPTGPPHGPNRGLRQQLLQVSPDSRRSPGVPDSQRSLQEWGGESASPPSTRHMSPPPNCVSPCAFNAMVSFHSMKISSQSDDTPVPWGQDPEKKAKAGSHTTPKRGTAVCEPEIPSTGTSGQQAPPRAAAGVGG